jgi:Asp/Glu/hydantoin racemase
MDDSLLTDTLKAGMLTNAVAHRILNYVYSAEEAGADVCMVTCTSVNQAAAYARRFARIPVFNIDEPMVREAVAMGGKIGVLGTLPTSPGAIVRLVDEESARQGKNIRCVTAVATGAFDILCAGDRKKHDEMVEESLHKLAKEVDVITFSQISMSLVTHGDCGVPVLKIGASGFEEAKKLMYQS